MRRRGDRRLRAGLALALALALAACAKLKASDAVNRERSPDASTDLDDETPDDEPRVDGSDRPLPGATDGGGGRGKEAGVGPSSACRSIPLDCLDPTPANVIEVPLEGTLDNAFKAAKSGDTVQVRGALSVGAGWRVPSYVTFRGCEGAKIVGAIGFAGSAGTVEGFEVSGSIVANQTGSYVVRYNRFVAGTTSEAGVSGRSVDGSLGASVTLVVDSNRFEGRGRGVEAATRYDTQVRQVDVTVRNNVFAGVDLPFVASESGIVGVVRAKIEHNTFYDFDTAIGLYNVDRVSLTSGNLFVKGDKGIEGSAYDLAYSFAWQVTNSAATAPVSGAFAEGDPDFVDASAGDLRLGPSSAVVDRIPNSVVVPAEDYLGCPRPAGASGAPAQSDVGAFESQP